MYSQRLKTLTKAYKVAQRNNKTYSDAIAYQSSCKSKLLYIDNIAGSLQMLDKLIANEESSWQDMVLRILEDEITRDLAYVYETDGYTVNLSTRVLRGKIRVEAQVHSYFMPDVPGDISDTQGRLFQQIVSFAALVGIMRILKVQTIYIDEAFSGAVTDNVQKINKLLAHVQSRGFNLVIIAQNAEMSRGISANTLFLTRSIDNKTTVRMLGGLANE